MSLFQGEYQLSHDGYLSYSPSNLKKTLGFNTPEDVQRYLAEWNLANRQYNEQFQLQKEAFDLNKESLAFNKQLALRQQEFAENSWENNITNSARQMATLGINPAASGGGISGPTMSGGSQVGSISSGVSASGRSPSTSILDTRMFKLQMLSTLMEFANRKREIDIAQQNANTNSYSAVTSRRSADADIALKGQEFRNNEEAYDAFAGLGFSYGVVRALENVDLSTAGLSALFKIAEVALNGDDPSSSDGDIMIDIAHELEGLPASVRADISSYLKDNSDSDYLSKLTFKQCLNILKSLDASSDRTDIAVAFSKYM